MGSASALNSQLTAAGRPAPTVTPFDVTSFAQMLTIEQLAAQSGMTVRNIRAHQAKGLLPPPQVRRRVGYYGAEHAARLALIRDLQHEGFNLAAIKHLLDDSDGMAERLARFRQALADTSEPEQPQTLTAAELSRRFRVSADEAPAVLARAQRLGVLVAAADGRFEVPSPTLLSVAEQVVSRGVALDGALAVFEQIEGNCDAVCAAFVGLFRDYVWQPFISAGMPEARVPEIEEAIARLRPLATEALLSIFGQRMSAQLQDSFGDLGVRETEPVRNATDTLSSP